MSKKLAHLVAFIALLVSARAARADEAALKDIQKTFGLVPSFMKAYPADQLAGAWAEMKGLQFNPATALPGKFKELIGLAVASQIPCRYCIYVHSEAAKLDGAADREVREAVTIAAQTRKWSTVLNGSQTDLAEFKAGLAKAFAAAGKAGPPSGPAPTDAASAVKEIERVFGSVPPFLRNYPEPALAGAWAQMRTIMFTETAIPAKYKELMGLAVASQIPCSYCVFAHTEAAKANGASDAEIREAVAMAGLTRQWSTWLNGTLTDEATFRREIDQVFANARKAMARK